MILARNRFEDNELVGAADVLSLSASSASLHLLDNDFAGNNASSLLRCAGDAASYAPLTHSPFVRATGNTFDSNELRDGARGRH